MGEKDYDPPMHSAEHLVNGAVSRLLGCARAFSTHIEKKKSKCDFRYERNLTEAELRQVERTVNAQIASGAVVREEMLSVEQAASLYSLSRLPEGERQVRIVHIGSYDSCPCIGPHVADIRELSPVRLVSSDWSDGILRVRFKFDRR